MKQEYSKPQVVKVDLKVKQTVLAGCKVVGSIGPQTDSGCVIVVEPCTDITQPS